ncbi:MAG: phosphotransferase [Novosphingobium sp.]|nr:phosphotransferase [Novosphingobium sp.]
MSTRTPRELIEIYWDEVYNNGRTDLIREVCADPIIRHDPECVTPLSHDEQIERVERSLRIKPYFTHHVLHADERFVTSVWNMDSMEGKGVKLCGIEVFEAENGRFTRCWNSTYMKGFWGEDGDLFDPEKLTPPPLLETAGEITANWIERAFAAGGAVVPQRIAIEPVVKPIGHGTSGTTAQVHIGYNVGTVTAPTDVIAKFGRTSGVSPGLSPGERERRAYALLGNDAPFRKPRMWYGASDKSGLTNMLLEDLSARTRPGDQISGCSIEEAAAVVRELAAFHAAWWGDEEALGLDWLVDPKAMRPLYEMGADKLGLWLSDRIPAEDIELVAAFRERLDDWLALPAKRRTLIHSDARVDNILFEDTADGPAAWIIDWQLPAAGDPQYDLAYFLSGSLDPQDRRTCERDLVANHAALIRRTVPDYSDEEALESYRRNVVSGLWLTVIAMSAIEQNAHNAKLICALMERNCAAIRDWDALNAF